MFYYTNLYFVSARKYMCMMCHVCILLFCVCINNSVSVSHVFAVLVPVIINAILHGTAVYRIKMALHKFFHPK